ncbi:DUF2953 domain-containing protein [Paraliobacillus sp. JSM ZJ581]|uniref:DUF2953 domain-containing protein n=1 Tax=Paraliobacillus sp. JSM ZJ581 TaxID=3342118 RepID=UPI0035A9A8E6
MLVIIIITILLLCLLLLAILLPVKLRCELTYHQELQLSIKLTIAQLTLFTYNKTWNDPLEDESIDIESLIDKFKKHINNFTEKKATTKHKMKVIKYFKKISIEIEEWETTIGMKGAATTGMLTGILWTIKGSVLGLLDHLFYLKNAPIVHVYSDFEEPVFQSTCSCIFSLRLGQAINTFRKINQSMKGLNV